MPMRQRQWPRFSAADTQPLLQKKRNPGPSSASGSACCYGRRHQTEVPSSCRFRRRFASDEHVAAQGWEVAEEPLGLVVVRAEPALVQRPGAKPLLTETRARVCGSCHLVPGVCEDP
eukprot:7672101-Heterocapsa_arctica.AAC.1